MLKIGGLIIILALFAATLSRAQDIGDVRKKYLDGMTYFANNDLKRAEANFKNIIGMSLPRGTLFDPFMAKSYYFMGDIAFIKQDYQGAIDNYKTVARVYYNEDIYSRDMYKLGRTLVLSGRPNEGIAMLEDYISRYGDKDSLADHSYYWLAKGYAKNNDYFKALSTYQFILSNYATSAMTFEVRNSISILKDITERQSTNSVNTLLLNSGKLDMEKEILEKMSRLLVIKQRLLEIKAAKVEALSRLKEQNGVE